MYYFKCKRCDFISKQKIDMQRHLNKQKKCIIINPTAKSDNELYDESLIKEKIDNGLDISIQIKDKKIICSECNKKFYNKSNLIRHINSNSCKKKEYQTIVTNNIQNIGVQNITNNTININVNSLRGFDEDWSTSKITKDMRQQLLLSDTNFTNTLKNILQNEDNLNVIFKDHSTGIVYKNKNNEDEYQAMNVKDILDKSMDKIYKHLLEFFTEIVQDQHIDNNILYEIDKKYNRYKKSTIIKNDINNHLTDIFDENKNKSIEKFICITQDEKKEIY